MEYDQPIDHVWVQGSANTEELENALRIVMTEVEMSEELLRWDLMPDYGLDLAFGEQPQHVEWRVTAEINRVAADINKENLRWGMMPDYGLDLIFGGQFGI